VKENTKSNLLLTKN